MPDTSIAVVVPVYNSAECLRKCLQHLANSTDSNYECIVVDDGSTDESAEVARQFGATVLPSGGRKGPAFARNLGSSHTKADVLFFVDADVCVHANTVASVRAAFDGDPHLDALIGSYDDEPESPDFLSQYRNLMHCYMHQSGSEQAHTFWSGCGAIRRETFFEHGGFNANAYGRPAIEDIELGYRMSAAGCKVLLDRSLFVKHLKRWTFWNLVKTDIFDRGIPWTELILRDNSMPNDLNVQLSQRVSVALVYLLLGVSLIVGVYWRGYFLTPLFAMAFILLGRYWIEAATEARNTQVIAAMTIIVSGIVGLAYWHQMYSLIPPVTFAYILLFIRKYCTQRYSRVTRLVLFLITLYLLVTVLFAVTFFPGHSLIFGFFVIIMLLITLNIKFYLFLAEKRGRFFAIAAIPFHMLYHFYNGISFAIGLTRHLARTLPAQKTPLRSDGQ